jgi:hypothetical protein
MTTMILELYDALKDAGASEDKAQAAAKAMASHDDRFGRIESELAAARAELAIVKWMVGGIGFGVMLLVLKSFWPH